MTNIKIEIPREINIIAAAIDYLIVEAELIEPGWDALKPVVAEVPLPPVVEDTPPPPPAPVVPPPPPASTTEEVLVDSQGTPWDARIHGSGKTFMKKDGSWKRKKGISEQEYTAVMEELRAAMGAAPVVEDTPPPPPAPVVEAPPAPVVEAVMTLGELMPKITAAGVSVTQIQEVSAAVGISNLLELNSKPELIPQVMIALGIS